MLYIIYIFDNRSVAIQRQCPILYFVLILISRAAAGCKKISTFFAATRFRVGTLTYTATFDGMAFVMRNSFRRYFLRANIMQML